jgi:hypothetical protein
MFAKGSVLSCKNGLIIFSTNFNNQISILAANYQAAVDSLLIVDKTQIHEL